MPHDFILRLFLHRIAHRNRRLKVKQIFFQMALGSAVSLQTAPLNTLIFCSTECCAASTRKSALVLIWPFSAILTPSKFASMQVSWEFIHALDSFHNIPEFLPCRRTFLDWLSLKYFSKFFMLCHLTRTWTFLFRRFGGWNGSDWTTKRCNLREKNFKNFTNFPSLWRYCWMVQGVGSCIFFTWKLKDTLALSNFGQTCNKYVKCFEKETGKCWFTTDAAGAWVPPGVSVQAVRVMLCNARLTGGHHQTKRPAIIPWGCWLCAARYCVGYHWWIQRVLGLRPAQRNCRFQEMNWGVLGNSRLDMFPLGLFCT